MKRKLTLSLFALCWLVLTAMVGAQSTVFTYQGRLSDNGAPANGNYDLQFSLRDTPVAGNPVGAPIALPAVPVTNGVFTVTLDFGANTFNGAARFLEIGVRTNGSLSAHTVLSPRQEITSTPYAIQSLNATTAGTANNLNGTFSGDVTGTQAAMVVASVGGQTAASMASGAAAANNATGANTGNTLVKRDAAGNFSAGTITANLLGNATTASAAAIAATASAATSFTGPLAGDVTGSQGATVVSTVGGQSAANVAGGVLAANNAASASTPNALVRRDSTGSFAANAITAISLSGDGANLTGLNAGGVTTGTLNDLRLSANVALLNGTNVFKGTNHYTGVTILTNLNNVYGGTFNGNLSGNADTATTANNLIGLLTGDVTGTQGATVVTTVGGQPAVNVASGASAANAATSANAVGTIVRRDGAGNFAAGNISATSFSGAGSGLTGLNASQLTSGIVPAGALGNAWLLGGNAGVTAGTQFLGTTDDRPFELRVNNVTTLRIEPGAGQPNLIGGRSNVVGDAVGVTIAGGSSNAIQTGAQWSTIGGGTINTVATGAIASTIGGGNLNTIQSSGVSTIAGGNRNLIQEFAGASTIAGGEQNRIQSGATHSAIGGGLNNTNLGPWATIPGGDQNLAATSAFAAGHRAKAVNQGAFIWADSMDTDFSSTGNNQFLVRAGGGVGINKNNPATALDVNGTVTATLFSGILAGNAATATTANNFSGLLAGDVTGTQGSSVVSTVGGVTAANVASGAAAANAATSANSPNTLVKRDAQGNLAAGAITAVTVSGNGAGLTSLNAGNATLGTLEDARLSTNVALLNGTNAFSGTNVFGGLSQFTGVAILTNLNNLYSGTFTGSFSGNVIGAASAATNLIGALAGDVTGSQSTTVVTTVGGLSAASVASGSSAANAATSASTGGAIVKRDGAGNFSAGAITATSLSGSGAGLTGLNASQLTSGTVPAGALGNAWLLGGNAGTSGLQFLGTTDNQPFELRANGIAALRIEPADRGPNIALGQGHAVGVGNFGATIGGGATNAVLTMFGTVAGGSSNNLSGAYATIGGGFRNTNGGGLSVIGGGDHNLLNAGISTIGGGRENQINGASLATISGGDRNVIDGAGNSTIGGGALNIIQTNAYGAFLGGGVQNNIGTNAQNSTIGGGWLNSILPNAWFATIPGGYQNSATNFSFAAGNRAKALHTGSFVWGDSAGGDFETTADNQFIIRASGGVGINTNNPTAALEVSGGVKANGFIGSGAGLTTLNAGNIALGTLADARLSANVPLLSGNANFAGTVNAGAFSGNAGGLTNISLASVGPPGTFTPLTATFSQLPAPARLTSFLYTPVRAADINGDGKMDLIAGNFNPLNPGASELAITLLTNKGDGTFALASPISLTAPASVVIAADVNGDGKADLIVNGNGNAITVMINDGTGVFTATSTPDTGAAVTGLMAADVNGDGKMDLIALNGNASRLTVLTNDGSGSFTVMTTPATDQFSRSVAVIDVDGDGKLDIVSGNDMSTVTVLRNLGNGTYAKSQTLVLNLYVRELLVADVNQDGKIDLITTGDNAIVVLTNNGNGLFAESASYYGMGDAKLTMDVNADGFVDLIIPKSDGTINQSSGTALTFLLNNHNGTFTASTNLIPIIPYGGPFFDPQLLRADLTGDGRDELIAVDGGKFWIFDQISPLQVSELHWAGALLSRAQGGSLELGDSSKTNVSPFIDFHFGTGTVQDYNVRLANDASNQLSVVGDFRVTGLLWGNGTGLTNLNADNVLAGTLADARLSTNVARLNGTNVFTGTNTFSALSQFTGAAILTNLNNVFKGSFTGSHSGSGADLTGLNASQLTSGTIPSSALGNVWQLGGNSGTTPGTHFLGTTDDKALEFQVNNIRVLRLEPAGGVPNVIAGRSNVVHSSDVGTVIGGGYSNWVQDTSSFSTIAGGTTNVISASSDRSTIGGGDRNSIQAGAFRATIAGGTENTVIILANDAFIGGGNQNISGRFGVVGGGQGNTARASYSITGGGYSNTINSYYSAILGGSSNWIAPFKEHNVIVGGSSNLVQGAFGTIVGGATNQVLADYGFIGGGAFNVASRLLATIGGGLANTNDGTWGTIGGGSWNYISGGQNWSTISGGEGNTVAGAYGSIGGGAGNNIGTGFGSTIAGGFLNQASSSYSTVGGGGNNQAGGFSATVAGGEWNFAGGDYMTISGGSCNKVGSAGNATGSTFGGGVRNLMESFSKYGVIAGGISNAFGGSTLANVIGGGDRNYIGYYTTNSTIGGGQTNYIWAGSRGITIGGGRGNVATNSFGAIPGGRDNYVGGDYAFAAGRQAKANHQGAFVWADSIGTDISSSANDEFTVRATGGVRFFTDSTGSSGITLAPGGNSWAVASDRNVKKNFEPLDAGAVLEKLSLVPVLHWNYKWESDEAVPHIGPVAQDFKAAFYPGRDDKSITTLEFDGVELAAIQGLNQKLEKTVKEKDAQIQSLEERLSQLEKLVEKLAQQNKGGE